MGKYCKCETPNLSPDGLWREGNCRLCWLEANGTTVKKIVKERLENPVNVDETTYKTRLAICNKCENRNPNWTCKLCSCHLNMKAKWLSETCPDNRWPLEVVKDKGGCGCTT